MAKTITTYMQLTLPEVSATGSPEWATDINTFATKIDRHDHTLNKGTQVPIAGLNINDDLDLDSHNIISINKLILNQLSAVATADNSSLFLYNGNLYYRNSGGTNVQITSGAGVNVAGAGSISGMDAASGVAYSDGGALTYSGAFTFTCELNGYADIECGDLVIRERAAGITEAIRLQSPAALVAGYTLILPSALPASTLPLVCSAIGEVEPSDSLTIVDIITDTLQITTGAGVDKYLKSDAVGNVSWEDLIPTGTAMVFYQAAAPTGWTRVTTFDASGNFLRVVNSGGGSTGGTWSWSTDSDSHSHTDSFEVNGVDTSGGDDSANMGIRNSVGTIVRPAYFGYGSGASKQGQHAHYLFGAVQTDTHSHNVTSHYADHKYADVCLCTKD